MKKSKRGPYRGKWDHLTNKSQNDNHKQDDATEEPLYLRFDNEPPDPFLESFKIPRNPKEDWQEVFEEAIDSTNYKNEYVELGKVKSCTNKALLDHSQKYNKMILELGKKQLEKDSPDSLESDPEKAKKVGEKIFKEWESILSKEGFKQDLWLDGSYAKVPSQTLNTKSSNAIENLESIETFSKWPGFEGERIKKIWDLMAEGLTLRQIGSEVGMSPEGVRKTLNNFKLLMSEYLIVSAVYEKVKVLILENNNQVPDVWCPIEGDVPMLKLLIESVESHKRQYLKVKNIKGANPKLKYQIGINLQCS